MESANVVGYAAGSTTAGNKIIGAQFCAVNPNADGIDLNDIIVVGYDKEEGTEAEVTVQTLDNLGKGGATYFFYDVPGELYGWLDGSDEPVENGTIVLSKGDGLWVSAPNSSLGLQTSGQVQKDKYAVELVSGNKMVVNSTPVAVDLNAIEVAGYDSEEGTEAEVTVQTLDAYGKGGITYFFYDVPGELYGWLDGSDEPLEDGVMMVQPGEGLWVSAPNSSFQLEIPGVNL